AANVRRRIHFVGSLFRLLTSAATCDRLATGKNLEIQFIKRFHRLAWILASTFVLYSTVAAAKIVGPYTPDSATLHLWHFDEVAAPVVDVAPGGTNFNVLANQATLGNASFPGFNTALSTYDGGPN